MKPPLLLRPLSESEQLALNLGLRSPDAFILRRCQILLASAAGNKPAQIARVIGCAPQTVRNAIHNFAQRGLAALKPQSSRPKTVQRIFDEVKLSQLKTLLHTSPRNLGKKRSTWTLGLLVTVCFERGVTAQKVSVETLRQAFQTMGVSWKRAKNWITSPDPQYQLKKSQRQRLIKLTQAHADWVLGFLDEVWWSRLAQPHLHSWTEDEFLRLLQKSIDKNDPDKKALSSYGLWCPELQKMFLRFVEERPVSEITCKFLEWCCQQLKSNGTKVLALVWDNASWHVSRQVRAWIREHNQTVKSSGGVRILVCHLPVKSPWLNPIEPKWVHGKRAIVEPERVLSAAEVRKRVCDYFNCQQLPLLQRSVKQEKS